MELREYVQLIGVTTSDISGNQLPTIQQVLKVLLYNTRTLNKTVDESIKETVEKVMIFWENAKIPCQLKYRIHKKLRKFYTEYNNVMKNFGADFNKTNESKFSEKVKQLFDIAHGNVNDKLDANRQIFLLDQRSHRRYPIACLSKSEG